MSHEYSLSYRLKTFVLFITLAAGASACVNKAQQPMERPPAPVTTAPAVAQDVANYLDALGKIVARETVAIQPQVSGRITQIHFTDGANVKKGQRLFTVDTRPFEANLSKRKRTSRETER
jgi:multidrug efflux system membrane fusion protein